MNKIVYIILFIVTSLNISGHNIVSVEIEPPKIILVTIDPQPNNKGATHLYWKPSISESTIGIKGYYIYRYFKDSNHNSASHVIDTVYAPSPTGIYDYIDINAKADRKSEMYDIVTFKDSVPLSSPTPIFSTIFLDEIIYDTCAKTNLLKWNSCKGWSNVKYNVVDLSKGTVIEKNIQDTTYLHNINYGTLYNYQIKAISTDTMHISVSNSVIKDIANIKTPNPKLFYIKKISNNGSQINFIANVDSVADLKGYAMLKSENNTQFQEIKFINKKQTDIIEFKDIKTEDAYYKISAVDICDKSVLETQVVKPIKLNIKSNETNAELSWNKSFIESTETYTIMLKVDNNPLEELENNYNTTTYKYNLNNYNNDNAEFFCFEIQATDLNGNNSFSETKCVNREPEVNFPNAFTPNADGLNDKFGPFSKYIKNVVITEFKLIIYDKYGGAIFETKDANSYWRGKAYNGYTVTEGGYIYYLWFKTSQNKTYESSGAINVLFP